MCTERIFDLKLQLKPGARYDANVLNGTVGKLFGQIWHIPKAGLGPSVCAIFSERIALGSHPKKKGNKRLVLTGMASGSEIGLIVGV